jgi:endoglucanase
MPEILFCSQKYQKYYLSFLFLWSSIQVFAQSKPGADVFVENKIISKTINIGFPIGSLKLNYPAEIGNDEILQIRKAGFTAVRFSIQWSDHMDPATNKIEPAFLLKTYEWVEQCMNNGLAVILTNLEDERFMNEPLKYRQRFVSLWQQLSVHYSQYYNSVVFEILAEPHGNMVPFWNELIGEALAVIRKSNPTRAVIVGPAPFNRPQGISSLILPEQDHFLIVTFHQYTPVSFTMQGETWFPFGDPLKWLGNKWPVAQDSEKITSLLDAVSEWAHRNNRPVFMGEFGVSSNADSGSAYRFILFNRTQAERRGFSWGYWSCFAPAFNLYEERNKDWNRYYLNALISKENN